jgi:hypothetical protein
MVKTKQTMKLQKRDWAVILLSFVVLIVGFYSYQINQARQLSEKADAESWLHQQIQINKLKACVDEATKPCDITPQIQQ